MRKFFALALAVAMVLSLASVAFAAEPPAPKSKAMDSKILLTPFFKYSADSDKLTDTQAEYGNSYYAMILEGKVTAWAADGTNFADATDVLTTTYAPITKYDQVEKLKIKSDFEMGEDLVESISIVKKPFSVIKKLNTATGEDETVTIAPYLGNVNVGKTWNDVEGKYEADAAAAITEPAANTYYYFVEIKTKAQRVTGDADIIGTLEFSRKADSKAKPPVAKIEKDDNELDFALNLFYEHNYNALDNENHKFIFDNSNDSLELEWDDLYLVKFDYDDEVEFTFGADDGNEGTFTVDASGQGKLVIDFNTKANEAICDANPGVKMFFVNFNGAKFNRVGEFEYEMDDLAAAYQVVDGQLVAINGLELDADTATFHTRTLGNYVFADAELVNPTPAVEAPVVDAPAVTNPSTGAAA